MSTHPRRSRGVRLALGGAIAGALAAGALAGPAMAASDAVPAGATALQAGGEQSEQLTIRKAGGDPDGIIAILQA